MALGMMAVLMLASTKGRPALPIFGEGFSISPHPAGLTTTPRSVARPLHPVSKATKQSSSSRWSRRRNGRSYYDDDDDDEIDDDDDDDEDNGRRQGSYYADNNDGTDSWDDQNRQRRDGNGEQQPDSVSEVDGNGKSPPRKAGYYRVYFNDDVDPSETELDWEVCSDGNSEALVLLPPAAVERPTAVLHFVGGTFFGSAPKLWYRTFLESVVRNTQTAIIVTPIPVTLFQSPLQHVTLTQKLQRAFETAWYTVLEDEYGADALRDIPLCGIGHSLGARLLTVLTTMDRNQPPSISSSNDTRLAGRQQQPPPKPPQSRIPPYKSMCLISFTNYGASAGIPGVATLLRQSRRQDRNPSTAGEGGGRQQRSQRGRNDRRWDGVYTDDDYDDDPYAGRGRKDRNSGGDGYDDEEEWAEIIDDLSELVKEQARRVTTALTPKAEDLEFFPTPDQLWTAIRDDNRYAVNETLLVQFDNDPIDQSSKLAQILHDTNSSNVKFARLRGTHLTPVTAVLDGGDSGSGGSVVGDVAVANRRRGEGWLDSASSTIWKAIRGRSRTVGQEAAMRDLRQSVVAYITDVVTK